MTFSEFNFDASLLEGLDTMGFKDPTPIQEQCIPVIGSGKDLIACAQTGTGKTAAYLLPVMNKIVKARKEGTANGINTLIIAPTRELALQIDQQVEGFGYFMPLSSCPVYGGGDGETFGAQKTALTKGVDIVIATPGKLISHLNLGYVNIANLQHLILDEADRMLDMGFNEDIMKIATFLPEKHQSLLFSATMPPKIRSLAKKLLHEPEEVTIALSKPAENILQAAYMVHDAQKPRLVESLLKGKDLESVIVFASTKLKVREVEQLLRKSNFNVKSISSDLDQTTREQVMNEFKSHKFNILVATDIVARGIDIKGLNLVINFDVPSDAEDYVHRIGRTARADASGVAITFVNGEDQYDFHKIEQLIDREVPKQKIPAELGEGPAYNPTVRSKSSGGYKGGGSKSKGGYRGGGNKKGGYKGGGSGKGRSSGGGHHRKK